MTTMDEAIRRIHGTLQHAWEGFSNRGAVYEESDMYGEIVRLAKLGEREPKYRDRIAQHEKEIAKLKGALDRAYKRMNAEKQTRLRIQLHATELEQSLAKRTRQKNFYHRLLKRFACDATEALSKPHPDDEGTSHLQTRKLAKRLLTDKEISEGTNT